MGSDSGLVRELRGRDGQRAARSLYRSYGSELYSFAYARVEDEMRAEELVQGIFTRAWHKAEQFDGGHASVRSWLYAIALEAVGEAERTAPAQAPDPDAPGVPAALEAALLRFRIQMAIGRLTADHRQILTLVHFRQLPLEDVAELTGLSVEAVKTRLHYAALNLRLTLDELQIGA